MAIIRSKKEIEKILSELESEDTVAFQIDLTRLIETTRSPDSALKEILIDNLERDIDIAYAAFIGQCLFHRRFKNQTSHGILFDRYRLTFSGCKSFSLFEALYFMSIGSKESISAALHSIKVATSKLPEHNGVRAAYVDIVAISYEFGIQNLDDDLIEAMSCINAAIRSDPNYAKYLFLRAKLDFINEDIRGAKSNIRAAIDLEDSSRTTYALRIGEYQKLELDISISVALDKIKQQMTKMERKSVEAKKEISAAVDETKVQVLVQLGFFAGVLSIILTAVNLAGNMNSETAIIILTVLSGVILLSWSALSMLVLRFTNLLPTIVLSVVGLLLVILGLIVHLKEGIFKWLMV